MAGERLQRLWPALFPVLEGCTQVDPGTRWDSATALGAMVAPGLEPPRVRCPCGQIYTSKFKPYVLSCGHHACGTCKNGYEEPDFEPCGVCTIPYDPSLGGKLVQDPALLLEATQYSAAVAELTAVLARRRAAADEAAASAAVEAARVQELARRAAEEAATRAKEEDARRAAEAEVESRRRAELLQRPWLDLPPLLPTDVLSFALLGQTGTGKSTTGNKLLGFKPDLWYERRGDIPVPFAALDQTLPVQRRGDETVDESPLDRVRGFPMKVSGIRDPSTTDSVSYLN